MDLANYRVVRMAKSNGINFEFGYMTAGVQKSGAFSIFSKWGLLEVVANEYLTKLAQVPIDFDLVPDAEMLQRTVQWGSGSNIQIVFVTKFIYSGLDQFQRGTYTSATICYKLFDAHPNSNFLCGLLEELSKIASAQINGEAIGDVSFKQIQMVSRSLIPFFNYEMESTNKLLLDASIDGDARNVSHEEACLAAIIGLRYRRYRYVIVAFQRRHFELSNGIKEVIELSDEGLQLTLLDSNGFPSIDETIKNESTSIHTFRAPDSNEGDIDGELRDEAKPMVKVNTIADNRLLLVEKVKKFWQRRLPLYVSLVTFWFGFIVHFLWSSFGYESEAIFKKGVDVEDSPKTLDRPLNGQLVKANDLVVAEARDYVENEKYSWKQDSLFVRLKGALIFILESNDDEALDSVKKAEIVELIAKMNDMKIVAYKNDIDRQIKKNDSAGAMSNINALLRLEYLNPSQIAELGDWKKLVK